MRRCEYVKMFDSPPLLGEPFAQTLLGKAPSFLVTLATCARVWFELACCLQQPVFIAKGYKSACQIHKIRLIWVLLVSPTLIRVLLVSLACKYALSMSPGLRQASVGFPTTCSHAFICSITYLTNFASFRELAAPHWFWHLPAR